MAERRQSCGISPHEAEERNSPQPVAERVTLISDGFIGLAIMQGALVQTRETLVQAREMLLQTWETLVQTRETLIQAREMLVQT